MIRKKQYITPLADFSLIEEEVSLLYNSIHGSGSDQPWKKTNSAKEGGFIFDNDDNQNSSETNDESFDFSLDFDN